MADQPAQCEIDGNADFYGIGVRVGLYSQWIAILLVTLFNPGDERGYRVVNLLVQTALFLGLCVESDRAGTNRLDPVIMLFLLCGSLSSLTGDGVSHIAHISGLYRVVLYTALSSYGCWFWFGGIDSMATAEDGCEEIAFFGRSTINGWFRSLAKAVSVFGLITCATLCVYSVYAVGTRLKHRANGTHRDQMRKRPQVEICLLVLSMGMIGFSIAVVEYLIQANNITGISNVTSVGQLIPLIVGGFGFLMSTWKVISHGLLFRKRCWFLLGHHL